MKGRIRGFFIPAGRERGAELVYTSTTLQHFNFNFTSTSTL
jgi:hypothetical protein